MRWGDLRADFLDFWREFRQVKSGIMSVLALGVFLAIVLFEPLILAFPQTNRRWRDITYWENNPRSTPPVWLNWFTPHKRAQSETLRTPIVTEKQAGKMNVVRNEFTYAYNAD